MHTPRGLHASHLHDNRGSLQGANDARSEHLSRRANLNHTRDDLMVQ